jgi:hypothetical protein
LASGLTCLGGPNGKCQAGGDERDQHTAIESVGLQVRLMRVKAITTKATPDSNEGPVGGDADHQERNANREERSAVVSSRCHRAFIVFIPAVLQFFAVPLAPGL